MRALFMITTKAVRIDGTERHFLTQCHPPAVATEALAIAEKALEQALGVEILDLNSGDVISFAALRRAAESIA